MSTKAFGSGIQFRHLRQQGLSALVSLIALVLIALALLLSFSATARAGEWTTEVLEPTNDQVMTGFCLETGADGDIYCAYAKQTTKGRVVVLAHRLGPYQWDKLEIPADPCAYNVQLRFDSHGQPHLMYVAGDWDRHFIEHLYKMSSDWVREPCYALGTGTGVSEFDFKIDAADRLNIVYRNADWGISFARRGTQGSWQTEVVPVDADISSEPELRVTPQNTLGVFFWRQDISDGEGKDIGTVCLAERGPTGGWSITQVDSANPNDDEYQTRWFGRSHSFTVDELGRLTCIYSDGRGMPLCATRDENSQWEYWILPMEDQLVGSVATLETSNIMNVAYYAWRPGGSSDVVVAYDDGKDTWGWETVGNVAEQALTIDIADSPKVACAVAYGDYGTREIVVSCVDYPSAHFSDVPTTHAYSTQIADLASREIISGFPNGTFQPDASVTRQQFAKMIVKTLELQVTGDEVCPFKDVVRQTGDDPFYPSKYVAVCAENGITKGKDATHFSPYENITRAQVITMVVRAADRLYPGVLDPVPPSWSGVLPSSDSTHGANIRKAEYNGLTDGLLGLSRSWNPYATSSRAECAVILFNLLPFLDAQPPLGDAGVVTQVVDGDTLHVQIGGVDTTVRLIGIDTPETGEPYAAEARAALVGLVGEKTVRLEKDVESTDQYGRTLAYVWAGSTLANRELLRLGLATLYTVPPNVKYTTSLQAAQDEAQAAGRGMWGATTDSPLEIVSINYDAPGNDNDNLNEEYVTFRVLVAGTLLGYAVEDESGHRYEFPDRVFQKGQVFKLRTGEGTDTQTDVYWNMSGSAVWNNNGDTVKVLNPQGQILLSRSY